jgi:PhnB protein
MNQTLLFDFSVDKKNKTVHVTREFAAQLNLVWDAWTKPELLDQWWAPKPYQTKTKSQTFKEGGYWLYALMGPEGDVHWCRADYK